MVGQQVEGLRASYHGSDVLEARAEVLNRVSAVVRGSVVRRRADGSEIALMKATYLTTDGAAGRRISALVLHRRLCRGAPLDHGALGGGRAHLSAAAASGPFRRSTAAGRSVRMLSTPGIVVDRGAASQDKNHVEASRYAGPRADAQCARLRRGSAQD
jgi:hypothetical protein